MLTPAVAVTAVEALIRLISLLMEPTERGESQFYPFRASTLCGYDTQPGRRRRVWLGTREQRERIYPKERKKVCEEKE